METNRLNHLFNARNARNARNGRCIDVVVGHRVGEIAAGISVVMSGEAKVVARTPRTWTPALNDGASVDDAAKLIEESK